jgi:GntR family transcriptional regulator/GntR family mannosyl-D-glycerate transport/metabolism transcriptional repressor
VIHVADILGVVPAQYPGQVTVDHYDPEPLYAQLAAILRAQITNGQLTSRDPMPSEQQLQQEHGVSRGTVRAAFRMLRDEGLVVTLPGRGSYVR